MTPISQAPKDPMETPYDSKKVLSKDRHSLLRPEPFILEPSTTLPPNSVSERRGLLTLRQQMASFKSRTINRKDPLRIGIPFSLLIHAVLLAFILTSNAPHPPQASVIEITLVPSAAAKKEIVSPPVQKSEKPPENTNRLSDVDSQAVREQVKRGNDGGVPGAPAKSQPEQPQQPKKEAPPHPQQPSQQPAKPPQKPKAEKSDTEPDPHPSKAEHHITNLKLDDATLAMKFGASRPESASPKSSASKFNPAEYQAFSRPPGSGAAFLGSAGISDHLPNLPDGDITMLNAKANIYASFVRRVAVQVFTQLRSQGWEKLSRQQIQQLQDFTTIEAVLSKKGDLLGVRVMSGSGSSSFDGVVKASVSAGAGDPNPPPGAEASDGLIHFIFKARSWSQIAPNHRTGIPAEQRWLLLATGLE